MPSQTITAEELRMYVKACSSEARVDFDALTALINQHFKTPDLSEAEFAELYRNLNVEIR